MQSPDTRTHARRRNEQRVGVLRRRAALASALGFVAFVGLAAHHAVGSAKHVSTTTSAAPSAAAPTPYFDERAGDFAFDDAPAAASAAPLQPPVAQTNVS